MCKATLLSKGTYELIAESIGLKVNYAKSMMAPINVSDKKLDLLANTFGCSTGSSPCTYLALPLSSTEPCVVDFWPLVSHCEHCLVSTSTFLSQAGRLELTSVVFTTLPTFTMCTF